MGGGAQSEGHSLLDGQGIGSGLLAFKASHAYGTLEAGAHQVLRRNNWTLLVALLDCATSIILIAITEERCCAIHLFRRSDWERGFPIFLTDILTVAAARGALSIILYICTRTHVRRVIEPESYSETVRDVASSDGDYVIDASWSWWATWILTAAAALAGPILWACKLGIRLTQDHGSSTSLGSLWWASFGAGVGGACLCIWLQVSLLFKRASLIQSFGEVLCSPPLRSLVEPLIGTEEAFEDSDDEDKGQRETKKRRRVKKGTFKKLLKLSLPDAHILGAAFICLVVASTAQAAIPHFGGQLIDDVALGTVNRHAFHNTLKILVGVTLVQGVFSGVRGSLFMWQMGRLGVRVRERLFASLVQQELGFFDVTKVGDLTSRLNNDATTMCDNLSLNLNIFARSLISAIIVLVFMFNLNWKLTLATFSSIPSTVLISRIYGHYFGKQVRRAQDKVAKATALAEEGLSAISTVRSFANERQLESEYRAELRQFLRTMIVGSRLYMGYCACFTALPGLVSVVVLGYGGELVLQGEIKGGTLVSFMLYQQTLNTCFTAIGDVYSGLTTSINAAYKVFCLLERSPKLVSSGALRPNICNGLISMESIYFAYPARPSQMILRDFSLTIQPGEVVALCGPSGGGKSSCIKLLERFYEPVSGCIRLDGTPISQLEARWYKKQVALVGQEPTLFGRSVRKNILYGLEDESSWGSDDLEKAMIDAAKQSNAHDFILALPHGYDTEVGEKGVMLSGGQKQRIAIARALVRKPAALLLDEATSALDAESEALVQAAIDRALNDHTVLVVAHRLSTIRNADRIAVVEKGQVSEAGSHSELLGLQGTYSRLVQHQMQQT